MSTEQFGFIDWLKLRFPGGCPTSFDMDDVEMAFRAGKSVGATQPQAPQGGWQPIETAPKREGVWIVALGCYPDSGAPETIRWLEEDWDAGAGRFHSNPTHWMPIPPAPKPETPEVLG